MIIPRCLISISLSNNFTIWQTNLCSEHQPILISLQMGATIIHIPNSTSLNLKKENWDGGRKEIEDKLSKFGFLQNGKRRNIVCAIILNAALHNIPPIDRACHSRDIGKIRARNDLRSRYPILPVLQQKNYEIATNKHKRPKWRPFVEIMDYKLWITIKVIDGKSHPNADNEVTTFEDSQVSSIN